ncbi:DUF1304 domain-containing protein [Gilvibacter sediminis]|uniref:DUF1304 domain-containing protein n=1 Tax=Gilvibacter sediminis TaxID=379071 RepID=UPI002350196F|nr:DUF1304 domain-containing protein [Gilvibacter sediminis]MDC7999162.1 DUF1304 domain-containing protein [Gilvibacter sediminis]
MDIAIRVIVSLVALLHLYFMYFEMFAWESRGPKVFRGFKKELFKPTKSMAANQGLYNGFLAAGLIWSLFITDQVWADKVAHFFLSCVLVAGIYGTISVSKKIFLVQGIPALIGQILLILKYYA